MKVVISFSLMNRAMQFCQIEILMTWENMKQIQFDNLLLWFCVVVKDEVSPNK